MNNHNDNNQENLNEKEEDKEQSLSHLMISYQAMIQAMECKEYRIFPVLITANMMISELRECDYAKTKNPKRCKGKNQ